MKKGIAALVIAAAMISTPGALNASSYFYNTQWLYVFSFDQHWSSVVYRYLGTGTWSVTPQTQGSYFQQFDALNNTWVDAYLYDYNEGRFTDRMILMNIKQTP